MGWRSRQAWSQPQYVDGCGANLTDESQTDCWVGIELESMIEVLLVFENLNSLEREADFQKQAHRSSEVL